MSTPNGHTPADPNGAAKQATSTVLALDGWGPVVPDTLTNGANGSEPEVAVAPEPMIEILTTSSRMARVISRAVDAATPSSDH